MYRTNHFNSSNFPICDLSNAQTYVCNVGAGTDTDFGFVLFQFAEQKFTESFVICIRNVQMCEAVDEMDFCAARKMIFSDSSNATNKNFLVANRIAIEITPSRLLTGEEWSMIT